MGQRLCKADVPEKFLTPQQGSLALEPLELRKIRKLVSRGKLAPFYPGLDDSVDAHELDECPICFLYHKTMNRSKCCGQRICSECFIQIKKKSGTYLGSVCPFCKSPGFNVEVCGAKSEQEKTQERLDEQRLLEHRLKERLAQGPEVPQPMGQNTSTLAPESAFEPSPPLRFPPVPQVAHQGPEEEVNERRATEDVEANNNVSRERLMSTDERQQESEEDSVGPARDDYREEFAALGRTLTNRDMLQCAEYLGVFPEDLGMPVDDFNELLLEQAIIRSMMDNNQFRHQQERQRPSQPSSNCIPNNQESHSDDQAEVGSWASDTIEPTLESASNGHVSAIATGGLDLVHGDEESHGRSDSHCSAAAQDKEDYIWEVGCSGKCVPSSSSGPSNADKLQPTEYSLLMKTQDFGTELVSRQASCPEQIEGCDGLWFNDVVQGAAERLQDSSQPSASASVTEASTSRSKVDVGDESMPSSSSGPMSGVPIRSASCPLAGSERDEIGGFGDLIASLAMSGEVNLDQKTVQLEMVFIHLNQPNIQRIEEENNPQPPQQILDDAMDQYLAGGNDDIQDLFDVEDSESEDASMPNSDRVSLASSQQDLEESSSLSATSEVFLASGDYHSLETKQITANAVDHTASKTVAFSNPDGSVVLVTVPDEHPTIPAGSTSNSSGHGRQLLPVVDCTSAIPLTEENIGGYLANAVVQRVIVENEGRAMPDTKQCDQGDVFLSQKTDEEFSERIEESDQQTRHATQGASQTEGGPSS